VLLLDGFYEVQGKFSEQEPQMDPPTRKRYGAAGTKHEGEKKRQPDDMDYTDQRFVCHVERSRDISNFNSE
jgi:hypothetical protein